MVLLSVHKKAGLRKKAVGKMLASAGAAGFQASGGVPSASEDYMKPATPKPPAIADMKTKDYMKKRHHTTTVDHHGDGSHTSHRHYRHEDGTESKESSAHADLDGVHDMLQDHLGSPNAGEGNDEANKALMPPGQSQGV